MLNIKKPKYMIVENVRALVSKPMKNQFEEMLNILDNIGYNSYFKVLNSKDHRIPHSRNRVFIVSIRKDVDEGNFEFPIKQELKIKASDLYDKVMVSDEFYLEEKHYKYFNDFRLKKKYSSLNSDILVCMTTKQGQKSNPQNFIKDSKGYRILTDGEMFVFQGFKREYGKLLKENGFTTSNIGYMLGNSITVTVLEDIFEILFKR